MNLSPSSRSVIILGAGPAGLSLGRELGQRCIPYLILEKDEAVGSTFREMTDSTTFGPWLNNTLPGSPVPWWCLLKRTTRASYTSYLERYAHEHQLQVALKRVVKKVERQSGSFLVTCAGGETFSAEVLVNCTGYFSKPFLPEHEGRNGIPFIHSRDYVCPKTVASIVGRERGKVLIVGSRLSAGEILAELWGAGNEVHVSHRGAIDTWPSHLVETLISPLTYVWEEVSLRMGLARPGNLRPRLRKGLQQELLKTGQVVSHAEISHIDGCKVCFVDGESDVFDLVIYATGYRPAVDHLAPMLSGALQVRDLESVAVSNCFFLGFIGGRSFRSEFLRGIREDAAWLAEKIQARMGGSWPSLPAEATREPQLHESTPSSPLTVN